MKHSNVIPSVNRKKVAYLFGAGATHAEIVNIQKDSDETFLSNYGLLLKNVSKRVIKNAQAIPGFKKDVEFITSAKGNINIELLISLTCLIPRGLPRGYHIG